MQWLEVYDQRVFYGKYSVILQILVNAVKYLRCEWFVLWMRYL